MSTSAVRSGVTIGEWVAAPVSPLELLEVVAGKLVVKRVGGNPHHYLARRLAEEFERQ